jgi:type II secretory pathway pseudopilin PulG
VIIIVGVLASLALPRLFRAVEFARSAEAFAVISSARRAAEACALQSGGSYNGCITWADLGMEDQGNIPNSHFRYCMACSGSQLWRIVACRNTRDGGDPNSVIFFEVSNSSLGMLPDNIMKCGQGAFSSISDPDCYGYDLTLECGCP